MVRCGEFDENDPPTPESATMAACPMCEQKDAQCKSCGGRGVFRIEQHPREFVPDLAYRVAQIADLYGDHGLPPVAGGSLDQSNWFITAAALCIADHKRIVAERHGKT